MNKTDDIANEMANMMVEMAAEWAVDDAERARKYKIASIFLAERMMSDLVLVKKGLYLKEAIGSYIIHQRRAAYKSLAQKIEDTKNLIVFLKKADQDYFIGTEEKNNSEAVQLMRSLADYFRDDCNNLQLAKISNDIQDFGMSNMDPGKSVADAIVVSLESSARDIFNSKE